MARGQDKHRSAPVCYHPHVLALVLAVALTQAPIAEERHPRFSKGAWIGLLAGGGGAIAATYVVTALAWLVNSRVWYRYAAFEPSAWSFVPVAGPWISVASAPDPSWNGIMVVSGVIQGLGVAATVLGFGLKGMTLPGPDPRDAPEVEVEVAVAPGPGLVGLSLRASF